MEVVRRFEVLYDGSCALCRASRRWVERRDGLGRFSFVDAGGSWVEVPVSAPGERCNDAVRVRLPGGAVVSGFDAVLATLAVFPRWRLVAALGGLRPLRKIGAALYRIVARHRHAIPLGAAGAAGAPKPR